MTDAGYDDWLTAVDEGEGYYLVCENGHGSLPPRRVCPRCGAPEIEEEPLPEAGTIASFTAVHVAAPDFAAETPYVTAIVDFGPVQVTGLLRDVDPESVGVGETVGVDVGETETTGERVLVFRRR